MDRNTHIMHEVTRLRLLAAALELQQCTKTETNIVLIPGGDRVIAIGTPAQVRAVLPKPEMPPELKVAIEEAAKTRAAGAVLPDGSAVFINYGDRPGDTEHLNCTTCGGSGHIDDQRIQQAEAVSADELAALLPSTYYMDQPDGGSVPVLEQLRRMARDAARYRWLRDEAREAEDVAPIAVMMDWRGLPIGDDVDACGIRSGADLDRAVDAAARFPAISGVDQVDSEGGHHD